MNQGHERRCFRCEYSQEGKFARCPRCGAMQEKWTVRGPFVILGYILICTAPWGIAALYVAVRDYAKFPALSPQTPVINIGVISLAAITISLLALFCFHKLFKR